MVACSHYKPRCTIPNEWQCSSAQTNYTHRNQSTNQPTNQTNDSVANQWHNSIDAVHTLEKISITVSNGNGCVLCFNNDSNDIGKNGITICCQIIERCAAATKSSLQCPLSWASCSPLDSDETSMSSHDVNTGAGVWPHSMV
jgi:hypothetical protein